MPGSSPNQPPAKSPTPPPKSPTPSSPEQVIEADDALEQDNDGDSALGNDDLDSSTASITSSILHYRTIHGRTYHSERGNASYWGSNDEAQSEVMDIAHHMFTLTQNSKLYLAPLKSDIQKALDVGCGTGIWAIDFADEYPGCEVVGTDISPIQPAWIPPNLKFEIEDGTQEWTFTPNTFDYVHMRYLVGCIPDWTAFYKEAYKVLKPGGWLESFEASPSITSDDGTVKPGSAIDQWDKIFIGAGNKIGRSMTVVADNTQREAMEAAGFLDIQEWNFKCPLSPWPKDPKLKEIGQYGELFCTNDTEGLVLFVANTMGWTREEVQVYIAHFRREIRNRKIHPYFPLKTLWGRKPEANEV